MKNLSRKEALEILNGMKVKIKIPKAAVMQNKRNAALDMAIEALKYSEIPNSSTDCISRQAAIDLFPNDALEWDTKGGYIAPHLARRMIEELPSAQPDHNADVSKKVEGDCISRQAAIDAVTEALRGLPVVCKDIAKRAIKQLPSAQPERTCVNCGRTANNGGWYADGRTRCPIEEHYALPKDGYCHLWEKRNVTDDDYPEKRTDE